MKNRILKYWVKVEGKLILVTNWELKSLEELYNSTIPIVKEEKPLKEKDL